MIKAQSLVKQNTNIKSNTKYNTYKCTNYENTLCLKKTHLLWNGI